LVRKPILDNALLHQADHQTEEEDNCDQVKSLAKKFHKSAELSISLAENRDDPPGITMEGKEANFLD